MKICIAQTRPVKGDIEANMDHHKNLIDLALFYGVDMIIFPELSITGYEPELAQELAADPEDSRFDVFQRISDTRGVTIGVGVPTNSASGICITMILFMPNIGRQTYSKKYLHADEEPFFVSGDSTVDLIGDEADIALAICYEISIPEHSENAFRKGAKIYLASVAKTADGVEKAVKTLSGIAQKYSMTVLVSNCVGHCDNFESGGKSSAWNDKGILVGQLNDRDEGVLIYDTETQNIVQKTYS